MVQTRIIVFAFLSFRKIGSLVRVEALAQQNEPTTQTEAVPVKQKAQDKVQLKFSFSHALKHFLLENILRTFNIQARKAYSTAWAQQRPIVNNIYI